MAEFNKKQYLDQDGLEALVGQVKAADKANADAIAAEVKRSSEADAKHTADIATVAADLVTEAAEARAAEKANADAIAAEAATARAAEADLNTAINTEAGRAAKAEENLQKAIDAIAGEGGTLEQAVADAKAYADTKVSGEESRATQAEADLAQAIADEATTARAAEKANADAIAAEQLRAEDAEKALQDAIDAHETFVDAKLTTLIGEDTNKSVRTIANEELVAQLIGDNAKENLDTLKEIADWIQAHPDDAAAMNKAIQDLEALVGTLPENVTATTVVGLIQELVKAEETRAKGVESGLDTRLQAVETAVGEGGSVETQINNAIAELDADVKSAEVEAGKGLQVQVVEVDGKITNVAVTGNFDATYDALGAAATAKADAEAYADTEVDKAYTAIEAIPVSTVVGLFAPAEAE